jgi:hypothetical protein
LITHPDDGPDHDDTDDPLAVILRPSTEYLGAPPGRYEAIRRGAARRRVLRAAAGAALTCGVAALVVLPLRLASSGGDGPPAVPLAPPPASSPSVPPSPSPSPTVVPQRPRPSKDVPPAEPSTAATGAPSAQERTTPPVRDSRPVPTRAPSVGASATPSRSAEKSPSSGPR